MYSIQVLEKPLPLHWLPPLLRRESPSETPRSSWGACPSQSPSHLHPPDWKHPILATTLCGTFFLLPQNEAKGE